MFACLITFAERNMRPGGIGLIRCELPDLVKDAQIIVLRVVLQILWLGEILKTTGDSYKSSAL